MNCKMCKAELVNGAKFCMVCGAKVELSCPNCGMKLPDIAQYCFNCGTKVGNAIVKQPAKSQTILDDNEMESLAKIKNQEGFAPIKGAPVYDVTPNGSTCDCAVGECDCDGSIWN